VFVVHVDTPLNNISAVIDELSVLDGDDDTRADVKLTSHVK